PAAAGHHPPAAGAHLLPTVQPLLLAPVPLVVSRPIPATIGRVGMVEPTPTFQEAAMAIRRWILAALALTCAGTMAPAQDRVPEPFPHIEVRGPQAPAGQPWGGLDALTFSRDGTRMAAAVDASIFVWNVADGKEVTRMQLP